MYYKAYGNNSLFTLSRSCDVKASISYESCRVKNNGDSCENLETTARK